MANILGDSPSFPFLEAVLDPETDQTLISIRWEKHFGLKGWKAMGTWNEIQLILILDIGIYTFDI